MTQPKLLLAVPTYQTVPAAVHVPHMSIAALLAKQGLLGQLGDALDFDVAKARNKTARDLLESACTHLATMDADVNVPPGTFETLLTHDKPVASAWYKDTSHRPVIFTSGPTWDDWVPVPEDYRVPPCLHRVDGMGLGCTLIKREVFEQVPPPWFKVIEEFDEAGERAVSISEDYFFARKLKDAGIPWFLDGRIRCQHIKYGIF